MNILKKSFSPIFNSIIFRMSEVKIENKIGFIYMNSPKDFNALTTDMKQSLVRNVQQLEESSDVKVIVLLSKVKKAFCAGANIK